MPPLYPTFALPAGAAPDPGPPPAPRGRRAWLFDFDAGDFVTDGAGRVLVADEHRAWAQWCLKALLTARGAHPVYSASHGTGLHAAARYASRAAAETALAADVRRALLRHPDTAAVRDIAFGWEGDVARVRCVAVSRRAREAPLDTLRAGAVE